MLKAALCAALLLLSGASNQASQSAVRIFRGTIGNQPVEMKLRREGDDLSGTYAYDRIGQSLTLKGRISPSGDLALQEFDSQGKQTGKFACRLSQAADLESTILITGKWSRPDGSKETLVDLTEQPIEFTNGLQVVTKIITGRRPSISAIYPQLVGGSNPALNKFNLRVAGLVSKAVNEFKRGEPVPDRSDYSTNFKILLATNDYLSIEINEYSYYGGPYPNSNYYALTYDLRSGKELRLDELFKPGSNYRQAIQKYALAEINKQEKEALKEAPPAERNAGSFFSAEEVKDWRAWAMTRKGIVVYFDFPHVVAAFDRVFIPYRALEAFINPQGPAALVSSEK